MLELPVARETLTLAKQVPNDGSLSVCIHLTGSAGKVAKTAAAATVEEGNCGGQVELGSEQRNGHRQRAAIPPGGLPADEGCIRFHAYRPDIEAAFEELPAGDGGFAFACGPTILQEITVMNALRYGFSDVHTETFEF